MQAAHTNGMEHDASLIIDPNLFQKLKVELEVDIQPCQSCSLVNAVHAQVQSTMLKYSEEYDGVPVAYSKVSIKEGTEAILHPYFAYLRVHATAELVTFAPREGMRIVGIVKRITDDAICGMVFGIFPFIIRQQDVTKALQPDAESHCWVSGKDSQYKLEEGTPIVFAVKSVGCESRIFSISGSISNLKNEARYDKVLKRLNKRKRQKELGAEGASF